MPLDYDSLTSITRSKILPGITGQIEKDMPLVRRLWSKIENRLDGGTTIDKVVRYALSTQGGFYSGLTGIV